MGRRFNPSTREIAAIDEDKKRSNEEGRIMIMNESLQGMFITWPLISIFGFGWAYFSNDQSFVESCQLGGLCYAVAFPLLLFQYFSANGKIRI